MRFVTRSASRFRIVTPRTIQLGELVLYSVGMQMQSSTLEVGNGAFATLIPFPAMAYLFRLAPSSKLSMAKLLGRLSHILQSPELFDKAAAEFHTITAKMYMSALSFNSLPTLLSLRFSFAVSILILSVQFGHLQRLQLVAVLQRRSGPVRN